MKASLDDEESVKFLPSICRATLIASIYLETTPKSLYNGNKDIYRDRMTSFKLVPFSLRLRRNIGNYLDLRSIPIDNKNEDFLNIFTNFCEEFHDRVHDFSRVKKTFRVENYTQNCETYVYGTVKTGDYGYELDAYDTKNDHIIPSARKEEYSEEYPFFFLFIRPSFRIYDMGLLILQYFKNLGMKTIFEKSLREFLNKINSELILEINPTVFSTLFNQLESADRILKVSISRKKVPKECAGKVLIKNFSDINEVRTFKAKRNKSINIGEIKDLFKDTKSPIIEIKNEEYEDIKFLIKKGGIERTIRMEDPLKFRESMPLDELSLAFEGYFPAEESLLEPAVDYANYILEKFGENKIKCEGGNE